MMVIPRVGSEGWDAWASGDRAGALEHIPDELVDTLIVHGSPEACREHIGRYQANGITTPGASSPGTLI